MGSALLQTYPSVLQIIRKLDHHLSTLTAAPSWTIEDILVNPEQAALVNEPEYSQPLCTAVQIALVDLMASWSLRPVATIGHSSGKCRKPRMILGSC
jgi:acyl transferase domain-containing protein